jgi:hypothetical protein
VRCVKTRVNLAVVSKLWREASKPAAAYPLEFDWGAFPYTCLRYRNQDWTRRIDRAIGLLDNDEALSLPYERVVGFLGANLFPANYLVCVCNHAALRGSVRLLKWTRENNRAWSTHTCCQAAYYGQLPALQYLHENGCPWDEWTCDDAAELKRWDCLQYAVDNKCPGVGEIRQEIRGAPQMNTSSMFVTNKLRSVTRWHEMKTSFFGAKRHESSKRREDTCCFNLTKNQSLDVPHRPRRRRRRPRPTRVP